MHPELLHNTYNLNRESHFWEKSYFQPSQKDLEDSVLFALLSNFSTIDCKYFLKVGLLLTMMEKRISK